MAAPGPCQVVDTSSPLQSGQTLSFVDTVACTTYGLWYIEQGAALVNGGNNQSTLFINGSNDPEGEITFDASIENHGLIQNRALA